MGQLGGFTCLNMGKDQILSRAGLLTRRLQLQRRKEVPKKGEVNTMKLRRVQRTFHNLELEGVESIVESLRSLVRLAKEEVLIVVPLASVTLEIWCKEEDADEVHGIMYQEIEND